MRTAFRFQSEAFPGASYVLRFPSQDLRKKINEAAAKPVAAISSLEEERAPLVVDYRDAIAKAFEELSVESAEVLEAAKNDMFAGTSIVVLMMELDKRGKKLDFPPESDVKLKRLRQEIENIYQDEVRPIMVRQFLKSYQLEMLDEDDNVVPCTIDNVFAQANPLFYDEISAKIKEISEMSADEIVNFKLPTTSGGPVDGQTRTSTVPPAENPSDGNLVTAGSTQSTQAA